MGWSVYTDFHTSLDAILNRTELNGTDGSAPVLLGGSSMPGLVDGQAIVACVCRM